MLHLDANRQHFLFGRWRVRLMALAAAALALTGPAVATASSGPCRGETHAKNRYTVCRFDAATDDIRVHHTAPGGAPYQTFEALKRDLAGRGERLRFAMNGGMYHRDLSPVGLLVIDGTTVAALNERGGFGNFFMKPNGVFAWGGGRAAVLETAAFRAAALTPRYATQSGPMLVIDGRLHTRFLTDATSRHIRNGVGVGADGRTVFFVISDTPVTFHALATFFRDALKTPNALYLDGSISQLMSADLNREDRGEELGPILSVIERPHSSEPEGRTPP